MDSIISLLVASSDTNFLENVERDAFSLVSELTAVSTLADLTNAIEMGRPSVVLLDIDDAAFYDFARHSGDKAQMARCRLVSSSDVVVRRDLATCGLHEIFSKPESVEQLRELFSDLIHDSTVVNTSTEKIGAEKSYHLEELSNNRFFLAASPAMMRLYKEVKLLAPIQIPVLLLGESGVGKEIVAQMLHKHHAPTERTFLNVNCAALPNDLLESELFGYEAGAFTGAMKSKPGKFEQANKGTLLLDEIGEMSPQMQAKLLHVLQDGSFSRLGARTSTKADVRILAATNIDMQAGMAEKRFREDLYYRLNTFTLTIPPLRERREEIPFLIQEMCLRDGPQNCDRTVFSERLIGAAQEYSWPGNLRELRNFVIRTLVLQDEQTAYFDLRAKTHALSRIHQPMIASTMPAQDPLDAPGMKGTISEVKNKTEIRLLSDALTASGWNRRKAAAKLNISYRSLLYKIQQHGLQA